MKMRTLLNDRILVLPDEEEVQTPGGIYLPETSRDKPKTGTVIQVGPGRLREHSAVAPSDRHPMICKEGDRVLYSLYSGGDIEIDGYPKKLRMMTENEVFAVIE